MCSLVLQDAALVRRRGTHLESNRSPPTTKRHGHGLDGEFGVFRPTQTLQPSNLYGFEGPKGCLERLGT